MSKDLCRELMTANRIKIGTYYAMNRLCFPSLHESILSESPQPTIRSWSLFV